MGVADDPIPLECNQRRHKTMRKLTDQERIDIVRYRIENAKRTLNEVESHIGNGYYNTAVNRMYYACFYAACAILIANEVVTKSHDGVKQMFSLHIVKTGMVDKSMGRFYSDLVEQRLTGDYEDHFDQDKASCDELLPMAKEFVATVEKLVNNWLEEQTSNNE